MTAAGERHEPGAEIGQSIRQEATRGKDPMHSHLRV